MSSSENVPSTASDPTPGWGPAADRVTAYRDTVRSLMPQVLDDLAALVAHRSVAFPGFPAQPVLDAAEETARILRDAGFESVELIDVPDGYPAVFAESPAPAGAPTVLLYAHYDVQPEGDPLRWTSPAWEATRRGDRVYGRGAADDKHGIVAHAACVTAVRAIRGALPVGVKVLVEGEEETASHLGPVVDALADRFTADLVLVADSGPIEVGVPVVTSSLRGHVGLTVQVDCLAGPVHSGIYGGAAPDAVVALIAMLARLTAPDGSCAVPGLVSREWDGAPFPEEILRDSAGILDGVGLVGSGPLAGRMWTQPAITVLGMDVPSVAHGANVLKPTAKARIGMRIAPGQDPKAASDALVAFLHEVAPWGVRVTIEVEKASPAFECPLDGPGVAAAASALHDAYGVAAQAAGSGGSIPLVEQLSRLYPHAEIILWGAEDMAGARIHAENEGVDVAELERVVLAQALLLDRFAG